MSLAHKATGSFFWTILNRFGNQGVQFLVLILLARLLTPEDFGLIAMILIFFAISQNLIDSGFSQALIRQKEINEEDKSTTFILNFLISILTYGTLWIAAPFIALFFEQPILKEITRFMGLTLFFYSLSIVQRAVYTQELKFKKIMIVEVLSSIITGVLAFLLAINGYGVWSLATNYVALSFFNFLFFYVSNPWFPKTFISVRSFKRLFGFGSNLLVSGLIATFYNHIYKIIIAKYFSASMLGYYVQANNFKTIFSRNITSAIQTVTYPLLSKTKDDLVRLKIGTRKVIQITSFFVFPGMIGMALVAEPLVISTLGNEWKKVIPMLQLLCVSGILYHLHAINLNIIKVVGRSDLYLRIEIIKKINKTLVIIIALQFGFWELLVGSVINSYISLFINMYYSNKLIDYSIKEQMSDISKVLLLTLPMLITLLLINIFALSSPILKLFVLVTSGALVYTTTNIIFKSEVRQILLMLIIPRIHVLNRL